MDVMLQLFAKILVVLFFVGVVGSLIVVVLSFIEDVDLLFESDDPPGADAPGRDSYRAQSGGAFREQRPAER
jgi:hypothetical protein